MIALASDCLLFEMHGGESLPVSPSSFSVEVLGGIGHALDADFVDHAAKAVFYYFKHDLGRKTVTVAEFAAALEKVLGGLENPSKEEASLSGGSGLAVSDLCRLACESGKGCELFFFPRLREELRDRLKAKPKVLRFQGLRRCVKQLIGARRWSQRCTTLQEQIVQFLRECFEAEAKQDGQEFALVVE